MSTRFTWPDNRTAAVSLRFDDGLQSHLDVVVPMLNERGFRGTFYLCPAGTDEQWQQTSEKWRPVHDAGHEIGNHTLSHPVPASLADTPGPGCHENMTLDLYRDDVLAAQKRLDAAFRRDTWTFCYPCYATYVGRGRSRVSVVPFIAGHFIAACVGGEVSKPYNDPRHCDLHALLSLRADPLAANQIIDHVHRAADLNRWIILTFHDVGTGRLAVPLPEFTRLMDALAGQRARLLIAPVAEVAGQLRSCPSQI